MADQQEQTTDFTEQVRSVIDQIRSRLQSHGGDVELVSADESTGVVSVRLEGACKGCPGARMTLKAGIEQRLKEYVPAVREVVGVE